MNSQIRMRYILILFLLFTFTIHANTIDVCATCDVKTIKNAVLLAKDGDTILVKKGVYKESQININRAIHIIGVDYPIIDAENKTESIFAIKADNFSISGLKLINVGMSHTKEIAAIFISHSNNFTIKDNIVENVFYGFILQRVKYGLIQNNKVHGRADAKNETTAGNGVHVWKSTHIRIEQNELVGMRDGIYLEFVDKSFVSNNTSKDNIRYGLHFMFSHHNEYQRNEFRNNGAGVAVMFSKFIKMHHNTFHYNLSLIHI